MTNETVAEARNEAFRRIGRNVVNLQRMEAMLQSLVKSSGIHGAASELEARMKKWTESIDRKSMGQLVASALQSVFAEPRPTDAPEDIEEPWFSFKLWIELDKHDGNQLKDALLTVPLFSSMA